MLSSMMSSLSRSVLWLMIFLYIIYECSGFYAPYPAAAFCQSRCRCLVSLHESNGSDPGESSPSLKVGIVGAGSIAFGTASLLSSLGHNPMLWSPSGAGTRDLLDASTNEADGTLCSKIQSTGALEQSFNVRVALSVKDLVESNDGVLVLALPVNGHKEVLEALAPEIVRHAMDRLSKSMDFQKPIIHIIISSHASLGAVYLMNLLKEEQQQYPSNINVKTAENLEWVRITCWGTTAVTARKLSGTLVKVLTVRQAVDFCTVPFSPMDDPEHTIQSKSSNVQELLSNGYGLCTTLAGSRFKYRRGGLLAISLSNLNPQNHLGIVLGNMSRMDPPPPPPPINSETQPDIAIEPWYQGKCITPAVGRLMEALDRERIEIANALDIEVRTIYQHFSWSFHVPIETSVDGKTRPLTVSEMNQQMHYYAGTDVLGPTSPDSRYVLEDVPYGLVLTVILGRLLNRPAVLHESGIMILSAMYGKDFMNENELLEGLGLIGPNSYIPNLDDWIEMAYKGCFKDDVTKRQSLDRNARIRAEAK